MAALASGRQSGISERLKIFMITLLVVVMACDAENQQVSESSSEREPIISDNPVCPTVQEAQYFNSLRKIEDQYAGALDALIDLLLQAEKDRSLLKNHDWLRWLTISETNVGQYVVSLDSLPTLPSLRPATSDFREIYTDTTKILYPLNTEHPDVLAKVNFENSATELREVKQLVSATLRRLDGYCQ